MDKGEFAGIVKRNTRLKVKFSLRFATRRYQQRCQSQRRTSYAHSNFGRIHYTGRQLSIPNRFRGVSTNEIRKCSWRNNLVIWNSCVWNRYSRFDVFYSHPLRNTLFCYLGPMYGRIEDSPFESVERIIFEIGDFRNREETL